MGKAEEVLADAPDVLRRLADTVMTVMSNPVADNTQKRVALCVLFADVMANATEQQDREATETAAKEKEDHNREVGYLVHKIADLTQELKKVTFDQLDYEEAKEVILEMSIKLGNFYRSFERISVMIAARASGGVPMTAAEVELYINTQKPL